MNPKLLNKFIRVCERAAFGASKFRGKNDKIAADQAAVDEMRAELNKIEMKGNVVIGEGEMDEAPMLFIGERLGTNSGEELDIAVDPLEGTNFAAKNLPNAISVMAITKKGGLLSAPDTYMEKIAIGSHLPKNIIDLDNSVEKNIKLLAEAKNTTPEKIVACVLRRPRHDKIIESLKSLNVKINFIEDGDVLGVISVVDPNSPIDIYLGTGGGPEGVLAAAALDCLGGQMQIRLVLSNKEEIRRAENMGVKDINKKYEIKDMIKGDVIFCATGVTDGDILKGIVDKKDSFQASSFVLHKSQKISKKITNIIKK
ncbi:MAG: class II fructose-bisphosphatase [Pelagibacteraceae bacterium]|nr:class II fructose-bisphosphatase [Pelagibacteraceae bacterium]